MTDRRSFLAASAIAAHMAGVRTPSLGNTDGVATPEQRSRALLIHSGERTWPGRVYTAPAAGLAATVGGQLFYVSSGDNFVSIFLNDGGAAVLQHRVTTIEALATPPGSSLVGYESPQAGAIARPLDAHLGDFPLSVAGFESLQAALDAGAERGGDIIFPPGTYALRQPLVLRIGARPVRVMGYGVTLTTQGAIPALRIIGNGRKPSRICGFTVDHGKDPEAVAGVVLTQSAHLNLTDLVVKAPSAKVNPAYSAILMAQSNPKSSGSGNFWTSYTNVCLLCESDDVAACGLRMIGAQNATDIEGAAFTNFRDCVEITYYADDPSACLANSVWGGAVFEQFVTAISIVAKSGFQSAEGLQIAGGRFEPSIVKGWSGAQQILSLSGTKVAAYRRPEIIRPKIIGTMNYLRDPEGVGGTIIDHIDSATVPSVERFACGLRLKSSNNDFDVLALEAQGPGSGLGFSDNAGKLLATLRWAASGVFDLMANAAQGMSLRLGRVASISGTGSPGYNLRGEIVLDSSGNGRVTFRRPEPTDEYYIATATRGSSAPQVGTAVGAPTTSGFTVSGPPNAVISWHILR